VKTVPRGLVRVIGRWSLAALMVNTMIGASVFGLPALIAARLGGLSTTAYFGAAAGVGVIGACLAEVGSQFREAGGPYLYAREAFGPFAAIQIGWLAWLSRVAASSAGANLFITYLSEFQPAVTDPLPRAAIVSVLVVLLAAVNYRGVHGGARLSDFFTIAKLAIIATFVCGGLVALAMSPEVRVTPPEVDRTTADWFAAIILMVYAYGGFDAALFAAGETRNPRQDVPAALLLALAGSTILFVSVQYVVIHTLPDIAASTKPVVDAARQFSGPIGGSFVAIGSLISIYGYLSANMLHTPRLTFALGQQGDFPRFFAAIHARFRTPSISIVTFAAALLLFAIVGDFRWNATLSVVARLFVYGSIAAALPVLRQKHPKADALRLPGGWAFSLLALVFTGVLITQTDVGGIAVVVITFGIALLNWKATRGHSMPISRESS
jgi:APA family basic amino acid/polyamine antiporter